jgi:hypothetical protein
MSDWATQVDPLNLRHAVRLVGEMKGCAPSSARETSAAVGAATESSMALAPRGPRPKAFGGNV